MASLYELSRRRFPPDELPEPARTQEAVGFSKPRHRERAQDRQDLRRIPGPDARRFRRENPDADIHDYARMQAWRAQNPDATVRDWVNLQRALDERADRGAREREQTFE